MGFLDKFKKPNNGNNKQPQSSSQPIGQKPDNSNPTGPNKNGTMFRISRPYGYYMNDVDEVITKYNQVFTELKNTITSLENQKSVLINENKQIKSELRNMQMQMSMLQLPDTSEVQDFTMLDKMKSITGEKKYDFSDIDEEFENGIKQQMENISKEEEELSNMMNNSNNTNEIILNDEEDNSNNNNNNNNGGGFNPFNIID